MTLELVDLPVPKTWEELVALKNKIPICIPTATRFKDDLSFYDLYSEKIPKNVRLEIIETLIGDNNIKLLRNNFPYLRLTQHLPDVHHYCLWSKVGPLSPSSVETEIKKNFNNKKYFWFENVEIVKSIPEIWHCHVFVKEK